MVTGAVTGPFDMAAVKAVRGHGLVRAGRGAEGAVDLEEALGWFDAFGHLYGRERAQAQLDEADARVRVGAQGIVDPDDVRHRPGEVPAESQIEAGEDVAAPSTEVAGDEARPISGLPETGKF